MRHGVEKWASYPIKTTADLTWALMKASDSGLLKDSSKIDESLIKTIMSELGTNIIKYAKQGVITLRRMETDGAVDILIEAVDPGPGIANIDLAMQDRYTTGTSLGLGLPSVRRLSDDFSITSELGKGTRVNVRKRITGETRQQLPIARLSSLRGDPPPRPVPMQKLQTASFDVACYTRPAPGEVVSGDMASLYQTREGLLLALVDVSGHGAKASALAAQINHYLAENAGSDIRRLMTQLHENLKSTLGAAVALIFVNVAHAKADFCAVGNVGAYRVVGKPWRPISKDGVLGQRLPTLVTQSVDLSNGDLLLMRTDGVSELAAKNYAAQNSHVPTEKLAVDLVSILGRPFDDASCIVFKWIA